ncbi:hypothetical protein QYS47_28105 (plasmid) [Marivirga arenosa]|nr:hypothetical protein QYS47_28105 [Marivirga sp. BKB1-2]
MKKPVNFIHQFLSAMDKISEEKSFNPTHVSLYVSLFTRWNLNHFRNPISINREEVMTISKIGSKNTYHKCLKDLQKSGFIDYLPSHNPMKGSQINMLKISTTTDTSTEQVVDKYNTTTTQVVSPSLNNINSINNTKNIDIGSNKNSTKKFKPPKLDEVKNYLEKEKSKEYELQKKEIDQEAEKFLNYYSAKGWIVGKNSKMKDWQAALRNWLLNYKKFNPSDTKQNQAGHLHNNEIKDYDIPL